MAHIWNQFPCSLLRTTKFGELRGRHGLEFTVEGLAMVLGSRALGS